MGDNLQDIDTALSSITLEREKSPTISTVKSAPFRTGNNGGVGCSNSDIVKKVDEKEEDSVLDGNDNSSSSSSNTTALKESLPDLEPDVNEIDNYLSALALQIQLISEDREIGSLGKSTAGSDAQIAIEQTLQEYRELQESFKLGKCLVACGYVPENVISEIQNSQYIDPVLLSDRDLALRIARGDVDAEVSLQAESDRFDVANRYFRKLIECCACRNVEKSYAAPCGHGYCLDCAQSLFKHALKDRMFIPVRCCKVSFEPNVVGACLGNPSSIKKYREILDEIENPCPPISVLDEAASTLISKKGWKLCAKCGAVVERASGCIGFLTIVLGSTTLVKTDNNFGKFLETIINMSTIGSVRYPINIVVVLAVGQCQRIVCDAQDAWKYGAGVAVTMDK
ncbi:hypothetical protein BGZ76_001747 [Entomortierella beljakovae]|nr:hypothetical protein BGZ76_001747 [Entomortierella beljakovae]